MKKIKDETNWASIDHESLISIPKTKNDEVNVDFYLDFVKEVIDNDYLVLGGNDNDDEPHPLTQYSIGKLSPIINFFDLRRESGSDCLAVKDHLANEWIVNRSDGSIMRIGMTNKKAEKGGFPTLVDMAITKFCNIGCTFCYTSSTTKGKHASFGKITSFLNILSECGTLEVVFGGGEPTFHPDIVAILSYAKSLGFKVGLTTKNYNLHHHPKFKDILSYCNSIAISCNTLEELKSAMILKANAYVQMQSNHTIFYYQTILGVGEIRDFNLFLSYIAENDAISNPKPRVTLLGFKDWGFGKDHNRMYWGVEWINLIKDYKSKIMFGVDSIIVSQFRDDLIAAGVDERMLAGKEGAFSCYVDAVESYMSPSSFSDEKNKIKTSTSKSEFIQNFISYV